MHRDLAIDLQEMYLGNSKRIKWRYGAYRVASLLLVTEVALWVVAIPSHGAQ
jgi:hypothetical protein